MDQKKKKKYDAEISCLINDPSFKTKTTSSWSGGQQLTVTMSRRDVSKPLRMFRELLLGRSWKTQHRFQEDMSPRPGPQPVLPESSYVTISANYYYLRDARRDSAPPHLITPGSQKVLIDGASDKSASTTAAPKQGARPGKSYAWERVE